MTLGDPWGSLGRPWGAPGAPWEGLGAPLGLPGDPLGTLLGPFWAAFGLQGSIWEGFHLKKHQKMSVFDPFGVDFGTEIGVDC